VPEQISVINVIQAMLSPGLMISACGLLVLGMNNKYSMVVNRIRLLNEERRHSVAGEKGLSETDRQRRDSVTTQLELLRVRIRLVRNSVFCYSLAVAFFVVSSLFIGLRLVAAYPLIERLILGSFVCGVLSLLVGVVNAALEIIQGYKIIIIEINEHS
jgi:hypothetical protein